jgi:hypothetical protein
MYVFPYLRINVFVQNAENVAMDTDKIKIFGARMKVDSTGKLAELERAERVRAVFFRRNS